MKNKFFKLIFLFFFVNSNYVHADGFRFDVKNIIIEDNGNLVYANFGTQSQVMDNLKLLLKNLNIIKIKIFLKLQMVMH